MPSSSKTLPLCSHSPLCISLSASCIVVGIYLHFPLFPGSFVVWGRPSVVSKAPSTFFLTWFEGLLVQPKDTPTLPKAVLVPESPRELLNTGMQALPCSFLFTHLENPPEGTQCIQVQHSMACLASPGRGAFGSALLRSSVRPLLPPQRRPASARPLQYLWVLVHPPSSLITSCLPHSFGLWEGSFLFKPWQVPLSLWLTLLFWQPLPSQASRDLLPSGHKASFSSAFSLLTAGADLPLSHLLFLRL